MTSSVALCYKHVIRETLIPLFIIVSTTCLALLLPFISVHRHNRYSLLLTQPIDLLRQSWQQVDLAQPHLWIFVLVTLTFGVFSILFLPGAPYFGPRSYHKGFRPLYRDTGFAFYSLALLLSLPVLLLFPIRAWYEQLVSLAACFVVVGLIVACFLFVKGRWFPSPGERTVTLNPLFDFYTGTELYPRVGRLLDLKQLINCRFGMWLWQLFILAAFKINQELFPASSFNHRLAVNVALQTIYIAKFFYWESGYMHTIDIALDHLGYYVGWGCIVWVPLFYTFSSLSSISTAADPTYSSTHALSHFALGALAIWLNYQTDAQRQSVRSAWIKGDKSALVWGRKARTLPVKYEDASGKQQQSILLIDGYWAWARHINYLFELIAAFLWSAAVCNSGFHVFFYFVFLTVLLVHRAHRDELKCAAKYGSYWQQYCRLVPYRIVPFLY
jgi:7-dehydrocholesterol reductase